MCFIIFCLGSHNAPLSPLKDLLNVIDINLIILNVIRWQNELGLSLLFLDGEAFNSIHASPNSTQAFLNLIGNSQSLEDV